MSAPTTSFLYTIAVLSLGVLLVGGCGRRYVRDTREEPFEVTDQRLARGSYLVNYVAGCGSCHTTRKSGRITGPESTEQYLGGGNVYVDRVFSARIWIPNITPDPESGLGNWTDDEIARAIRDGVRPDGRYLTPWMPWTGYQYMSDEDVKSIVVYLRSIPAVRQTRERKRNQMPWYTRLVLATGKGRHEPVRNVPTPERDDPLAYGEYLVHIGHCGECHSLGKNGYVGPEDPRYLAGSEVPYILDGVGKVWARNLTPDPETGIGGYEPADIKEALRTGRRLDGKRMAAPMSIFNVHYTGIRDDDLDAIAEFLLSRPAQRHDVPERELTAEAQKALAD